ncbi:alpha/beta fold hydrolase [Bradyrhizobium sp.]|uniref:alpha/beta fold hydrolase n=1 Tax=Bradyrhizobium sp. TaxID=376 RepID=UPI003C5FB654
MADTPSSSTLVQCGNVTIETITDGKGPAFVILPSYGRDGGADYDPFVADLVRAGWRALRPQPRGIAGSTGPMTDVSLRDLADDVALCIRRLDNGPAVVLGHAFGHALAKMLATDHPELVKAVVLAAAQAADVAEDIAKAPLIAGDTSAPEAARLAALRKAFFAPGHDPRIWLAGWYPATLRMQHGAAGTVALSDYWACGDVPLLELIGACDPFRPKRSWDELRSQFGDRVTTTIIQDASHALFPEQPDDIADAVLPWAARFV